MTKRKASSLEKEIAYREVFLARLSQKLAAPTDQWPTTRCWTDSSLKHLIRSVRDELSLEEIDSSLTHQSLLKWVCRLGLACDLSAAGATFYILEIGANTQAQVDPHELLMAAKPAGVICYFSAVAFHSLTTQTLEHHHVAELKQARAGRPPGPSGANDPSERLAEPSTAARRTPPTFGELLFHYQGTPFYFTRRSARLVPGVQTRGYGPRSQIRITTLEQTLLDTLYKPFHCGGPEVVFEAWQEALASGRADEERMAEYLRQMDYPATARRVGVMLGIMRYSPGKELKAVLDTFRERIDRTSPFAWISLLPGLDYQNLDEHWLVRTP